MSATATATLSIPELREAHHEAVRTGDLNAQARYFAALKKRGQIGPNNKPFVWGEIRATHTVGEYAIVESVRDHAYWHHGVEVQPEDDQAPHFHSYVEGKDTSHSHPTLDAALAFCIAYKYEGANTRAAVYFLRGIGA